MLAHKGVLDSCVRGVKAMGCKVKSYERNLSKEILGEFKNMGLISPYVRY
jgi:hypothetical protein